MTVMQWTRRRSVSQLLALMVWAVVTPTADGQSVLTSRERADDLAGFKEFSVRVHRYQTLQRTIASSLPALKPTDLPEMITAHQQVLARKIRDARPDAKAGDLFTPAAREAFRHAARAALTGPRAVHTRAYMLQGAANAHMHLVVNGLYPDGEPITALSPELLAAFPALPAEIAYRIVGRTLVVVDVESRLVVDMARLILPPKF